MRTLRHGLAVAGALLTASCGGGGTGAEPADLVVLGGTVHTADTDLPTATALAVRDGMIVHVGSDESVSPFVGPQSRVIDLEGEAVLPGFADGHVHLESGQSLVRGVDLTGIGDRAEWLRRIQARAEELEPGAWIVGGRWDHNLTASGAWPTKEELDQVTPNNPVSLSHIDGHYTWVNSLALETAGVEGDTPNPEGGRIDRDPETGEATGILLETASGLVGRHIPPVTDDDRQEILRRTLQRANALGITSAHNMAGIGRLEDYAVLAESGELTVRVWWGATGAAGQLDELRRTRDELEARIRKDQGPLFQLGYVKMMADGVLSAYTASLLEPYADNPEESGLPRTTQAELTAAVTEANAAGFPVAVHAIGDRAVRMALDAFEQAAANGAIPPLPNRIEHIEVVSPEDAPRFAQLGVLASFNPHHCITGIDVYNTARLAEERAAWSFPWGRLRDRGASLVLGSDWATAPLDPIQQLYAATIREKPAGGPPGGWHPDNRLSWEEALDGYTLAPAKAAGWDRELGTLSVGKWADFVILDGPVPEPLDRRILERRVRATYLAGEAVFER